MKAIIDNEIVDLRVAFVDARMNPLCGWLWLEEHLKRQSPPQSITILYDGNPILKLTPDDKPTKKMVKAVMDAHSHS